MSSGCSITSRQLVWLLFGSMASLVATATCVSAQTPVTIDVIVRAWRERQDRVATAEFNWTEVRTLPKGHYTDILTQLPGSQKRMHAMGIQPGAIIPPQDLTVKMRRSVLLDGSKLRHEFENWHWSAQKGAYAPRENVHVFDGESGIALQLTGPDYAPFPFARIVRSYPEERPLALSPLVIALRPFLPDLSLIDVKLMKLTGRRASIEGRQCLELEVPYPGSIYRVWVDVARDYVPVRYVRMAEEQTRARVDVVYRQDSKAGWIPVGWDIVSASGVSGKLGYSSRSKVVSHQINLTVEPQKFGVEFPPGTRVHDGRNQTSPVNYIVKEEGRKRPIAGKELTATYDQLLNSEPGEAFGKPPHSLLSWTSILAVTIICVAVSLLVWWRWAVRRQRVQSA